MKLFHSRDPVAAATSAAEGSEDKSTQQLLDVIKFLRREKEISDTKCEVKLKQKCLVFCVYWVLYKAITPFIFK